MSKRSDRRDGTPGRAPPSTTVAQTREEAIANALWHHCDEWLTPKTNELEGAAKIVIAYLSGAGYSIHHETDEPFGEGDIRR